MIIYRVHTKYVSGGATEHLVAAESALEAECIAERHNLHYVPKGSVAKRTARPNNFLREGRRIWFEQVGELASYTYRGETIHYTETPHPVLEISEDVLLKGQDKQGGAEDGI